MSEILVMRKKLQEFYANKSIFVDKTLQFILGVVTFFLINKNIGVFKIVTSPIITILLAVVCTFLPPIVVVLVAATLILLHLYKISLGVMAVTALIFIMMYIFYCRFTPKKAIVLLLTPLAFWLNVPYVVPVLCGLASTPISVVPVAFGTIVYYMIAYVKESSAAITGAEGLTAQITLFVKSVFMDKELWIVILAFAICVFTVYVIRRRELDHAWKIAIAAGAIVNIVIGVAGNVTLNLETSYTGLVVGNVIAIVMGIVLEFFLFSVDYTRAERIQYEDDEYYYYVKAVPKVSIAVPEKTVKRINEHRDYEEDDDESEVIRRRPPKKVEKRRPVKKRPANTEELLLARSMQEELGERPKRKKRER